LWNDSINDSLKEFNKNTPTLSDYEEKLKLFEEAEAQIDSLDPVFKIGAMALKTESLKQGLKTWVKEWKGEYAEDLHKRAKNSLDQLSEQTKNLQSKLQKEVKDIDSLGMVMSTLEENRQQESEIDMKFGPVFNMYDLYNQFLPNNTLDTQEMDARSVLKRNWRTWSVMLIQSKKSFNISKVLSLKSSRRMSSSLSVISRSSDKTTRRMVQWCHKLLQKKPSRD